MTSLWHHQHSTLQRWRFLRKSGRGRLQKTSNTKITNSDENPMESRLFNGQGLVSSGGEMLMGRRSIVFNWWRQRVYFKVFLFIKNLIPCVSTHLLLLAVLFSRREGQGRTRIPAEISITIGVIAPNAQISRPQSLELPHLTMSPAVQVLPLGVE